MRSGKIDKIWNILGSVPDPEIPVISVVELGVIRNVEYIENEYIILTENSLYIVSASIATKRIS